MSMGTMLARAIEGRVIGLYQDRNFRYFTVSEEETSFEVKGNINKV